MKQHAISAAVAAAVAALATTGTQTIMPPRVVETQVTIATSKHAWPDLSTKQIEALAGDLKFLAGGKVEIFCDGADCRDLQTDLDDALELAGVDSSRVMPVNPLGYGMAVMTELDDGRARQVAAAIAMASGLPTPKAEFSPTAKGRLFIVIGKRPR